MERRNGCRGRWCGADLYSGVVCKGAVRPLQRKDALDQSGWIGNIEIEVLIRSQREETGVCSAGFGAH